MNKYKVYGKIVDDITQTMLDTLVKSPSLEGQNIAIMPDNHAGKGACIGFTSTFDDKIIPNIVGVDLSCGMMFVKIPVAHKLSNEELHKLHEVIELTIPHGDGITGAHQTINENSSSVKFIKNQLSKLTFKVDKSTEDRILKSIGSLGGGNHFIEVSGDETEQFLIIHSGSRLLGQLVTKYHQDVAERNFTNTIPTKEEILAVEPKDRSAFIANYKKDNQKPEKDMEYLIGEKQVNDYLNDVEICAKYASLNRFVMIDNIFKGMGWDSTKLADKVLETVHNYIDVESKIIRKGAIKVSSNSLDLIPLNMKDGTLIVSGKDNKDANYSAPHGAGRLMSRTQAKENIKIEDFIKSMEGIFSKTVSKNTLDESPFAYKSKETIIEGIEELCEIVTHLKPIFNFKDDSEKESYKEMKERVKNK